MKCAQPRLNFVTNVTKLTPVQPIIEHKKTNGASRTTTNTRTAPFFFARTEIDFARTAAEHGSLNARKDMHHPLPLVLVVFFCLRVSTVALDRKLANFQREVVVKLFSP